MKTAVELALAIASGLLGVAALILYTRRREADAGAVAAIGLVLCNIVWVMRL